MDKNINIIEKEIYKCKTCDKICLSKSGLSRHINKSKHDRDYISTNCECCNITFPDKYRLDRHNKSRRHIKKMENNVILKNIDHIGEFKIPMYNKKGDIIAHTIVDKDAYIHILEKNYSITLTIEGYAQIGLLNGEHPFLHKYLYYDFYKNIKNVNMVIDHYDRVKLNNTKINLIEKSYSDNGRNKSKSKNASSKYYGVSKVKDGYSIRLDTGVEKIRFKYKNEIHAAWHYNLLVKEFHMENLIPINDINEPDDFIIALKKNKKHELPYGVHKQYGNNDIYCFSFKQKKYYSYETPEAAQIARNKMILEYEQQKTQILLNTPIKRNDLGLPIIELFDKDKNKVNETIVDEELYYDLIKYAWYCSSEYVIATFPNQISVKLSRFIMGCTQTNIYIDHKNGNTMDNRVKNLKTVNASQNSQNKKLCKNNTTGFVGVYKYKYKYRVGITIHKKKLDIGIFNDLIEAALARDYHAWIANKTQNCNFSLNFPEIYSDDDEEEIDFNKILTRLRTV
jgi:hypothetical protein